MPGSFRVKVMLLKKEVTYGVDPTPVAASDGVLLRNISIMPLEADFVDRSIDGAAMGHMESIPVGAQMMIDGEAEFSGSGAAGTAPKWGLIARLCGCAETLTASTDAKYNPISSAFESGTAYFYFAGKLHKLLGVRGSPSLSLSAKGIPVIKYKLQGLYGGITDASIPSGLSLAGWTKPVAVNKLNTPAVSLFGATLGWYDFSADFANQVVYRNVPGQEDIIITDRAPTGSITIVDPTIATVDFFTTLRGATLGSMTLTHGTTAGNIVEVTSAYTQITKVGYEDKDGDVALKLDLKFAQSAAGNDNLILVAR